MNAWTDKVISFKEVAMSLIKGICLFKYNASNQADKIFYQKTYLSFKGTRFEKNKFGIEGSPDPPFLDRFLLRVT